MIRKILTISMLATSVLITTSCENDDDDTPLDIDTTPASTALMSGTWRITNFEEDGVNKTINFEGYNFTFNEGNMVAVDGNNQVYEGSWSVVADDDYDTPPDTNIDLNIYFSSPVSFRDLNDDWDILSITDTTIEVGDIEDDEPSDYLTFEKN
ncbi:hypothetical protein SAMN05216480_11835 [Pustulibacterium marinum]|uniref:Lipocalin-like domain-containing protein n=1 Tax=Pustulibacterium marinum TaxID=1224947 RepID=A0A1I7IN90_9FLAO|nr:hypothetical protein [Pustulibacterium marinum]SFU74369.1 hypothetical protein SAMN05216480_11835 [Pustulibacterium marinum]